MSEDIADRLRQLARDHSAGRLGLLDYRKLRAPLLDFLVIPASVTGAEGVGDESVTTRPQFVPGTPSAAAASPAPESLLPEPLAAAPGASQAVSAKLVAAASLADATQHGFSAARLWKFAAALLALLLLGVLGDHFHWVNR